MEKASEPPGVHRDGRSPLAAYVGDDSPKTHAQHLQKTPKELQKAPISGQTRQAQYEVPGPAEAAILPSLAPVLVQIVLSRSSYAPRTPRPISLGYSHFHELRQRGNLLVDKSLFIHHVLQSPYTGMLMTRPRRFGKTLNMSMLKDFLGRAHADMTPYFEDLQIWQVSEARVHFQKYPVIFVSFKDCKGKSWRVCWNLIREALCFMLLEHQAILSSQHLLDQKTIYWLDAALKNQLEPEEWSWTLKWLSQALATLHGAPVVILMDEYDTPIHNALEHGFYDEAISFFKGFLGAGFKDNPHLFRGVMTGILRVSKENMFSDLNNVGVYSLLHEHFKADFGFTEEDVRAVLDEHGCPHLLMVLLKEHYIVLSNLEAGR